MSLSRLIYYSAIIGGWAAFFGWLLAECLLLRGQGDRGGLVTLTVVGAIVGAAIGAGLNVVAGIANTRLMNLLMRVPVGLIGGGIGGALGILAGQMVYSIGLPRALGFMLLGLGVGVVEGLYERSPSKIRNGLIGGLVGGLAGGFLFDPVAKALQSSYGISSRAVAFVILGICIGAMVGLVQVVLKQAWLSVLDGYGVGREIILSDPVTILGRGDHLRLPFLGPANVGLDPEHLRIVRQADGSFTIEDNNSKLGVSVRSPGAATYDSVGQPRPLRDGDVIRFGPNLVRFSQRGRRAQADAQGAAGAPAGQPASPLPPPPPPRKKQSEEAGPPSTAQPSPPTAPAATASPSPTATTGGGGPPPAGPPQPKPAARPSSVPPPPPPPPRKTQ